MILLVKKGRDIIMNALTKMYEIITDAPEALDFESYRKIVQKEYMDLLDNPSSSEHDFQKFFENNPSFIPGSYELIGHSGHYPTMCTLISQPEIGTSIIRKPDFLWLAGNSLFFCPVFVEIESPHKKMFNKDNTSTAIFNQALQQIEEWKALLSRPTTISAFYEHYNIPLFEREKTFRPQFLLVYGRRSEYENNALLTGIRAQKEKDDLRIMSFDRLQPSYEATQFTCCKVTSREYSVISIPPTFKYGPDYAEFISKMQGFKEKIHDIKYISPERREFLTKRYSYWIDYSKIKEKGLIHGGDFE